MSLEQAQIQLGGCVWVGAFSEACKLGSVRLRRTLESPGLSWMEDLLPPRSLALPLADSELLLLTLCMESGQKLLSPHPKPRAGSSGGSRNWTRSLSFRHSPLRAQVTARVPGGGGWRRTDAFVVILHLESNGPAQPPGDVQQPLHNELVFLLPRNNQGAEPRVDPWDASGVL